MPFDRRKSFLGLAEGLFQRGNYDTGEARFEAARDTRALGDRLRLARRRHRPNLPAAREIGHADDGVENAEPRHRHTVIM